MSQNQKILNQHEVNKLILAKDPEIHPPTEILSYTGWYESENERIYKTKKLQFTESVRQYMDLDKTVKHTNKIRTDASGDAYVKYEFLNECEEKVGEDYLKNVCIRKRTERGLNSVTPKNPNDASRNMQPWFKRSLVLNKLIQAARKLIIKNRTLKRLEKLKNLSEQSISYYENMGYHVYNECYAELFDRFISSGKNMKDDVLIVNETMQ